MATRKILFLSSNSCRNVATGVERDRSGRDRSGRRPEWKKTGLRCSAKFATRFVFRYSSLPSARDSRGANEI